MNKCLKFLSWRNTCVTFISFHFTNEFQVKHSIDAKNAAFFLYRFKMRSTNSILDILQMEIFFSGIRNNIRGKLMTVQWEKVSIWLKSSEQRMHTKWNIYIKDNESSSHENLRKSTQFSKHTSLNGIPKYRSHGSTAPYLNYLLNEISTEKSIWMCQRLFRSKNNNIQLINHFGNCKQ